MCLRALRLPYIRNDLVVLFQIYLLKYCLFFYENLRSRRLWNTVNNNISTGKRDRVHRDDYSDMFLYGFGHNRPNKYLFGIFTFYFFEKLAYVQHE